MEDVETKSTCEHFGSHFLAEIFDSREQQALTDVDDLVQIAANMGFINLQRNC